VQTRDGNLAAMQNSSVVYLLRERAGLRLDDLAFRYTDYEQEWAGVTETLSWAQLYQRTLNVAHEVERHGAVGDRAVILAPQGVAYIVAFLGAMQAGLIAVPLSVPAAGSDDTAAISKSHGLNVADLVLVSPGSIPTTTSGKIRRAACVEQHRQQQFTRLDA
jgi:acyl-CoA synthetase (AMP-forming)/AMP-acid ligase II